jgi:ABC-type multidrug transport system fused ATPase/permease subunit
MAHFLSNLTNKMYRFGLRVTRLDRNIKFPEIDFDKTWLSPALDRWPLWIFIISGRLVSTVFVTLLPVMIGYVLDAQAPHYLWLVLLGWFVVELYYFATSCAFDVEQSCIGYGVRYHANKFFLTVDPIYHAMRTSGRLFSKINRGAHAYEDILTTFVYELVYTTGSVVTVVTSLFVLNLVVGTIAFAFLSIISLFNIATVLLNAYVYERNLIEAEDEMRNIGNESLARIELVRSSFATDELNRALFTKSKLAGGISATQWMTFGLTSMLTRMGYAVGVVVLGLYVLSLVRAGTISLVVGTSFLATYVSGSFRIMRIGERIQKMVQSIIRVQDLYTFIRGFGQQTFPVLHDETIEFELPVVKQATIEIHGLEFAYSQSAQIFDEHSLDLVVPYSQSNKLYGIIGPSGVGKTTLMSIIGGQLRPTLGSVKINGVSMYDIDDDARRQLVAMQGQTASSLSGTVRDSLLLGLPKDRELFPDHELISILDRVGLWKIFKCKEGLHSFVGEAGMTLSIGQRQRLNFAALYLRTKYFEPELIMIDEPTSSLDQVSEQAITDMIDELAHQSVTFVIAHRLHTLEKAVGILDVSLTERDKKLIFYDRDELAVQSPYYRRLMEGEEALEEHMACD